MKCFLGVLVGGPKDGEWCDSDKPELLVYELDRTAVGYYEPDDPPKTVPYKSHVYRWHRLPIHQATFGMFIHESMTIEQAFARVTECYRPIRKP